MPGTVILHEGVKMLDIPRSVEEEPASAETAAGSGVETRAP